MVVHVTAAEWERAGITWGFSDPIQMALKNLRCTFRVTCYSLGPWYIICFTPSETSGTGYYLRAFWTEQGDGYYMTEL